MWAPSRQSNPPPPDPERCDRPARHFGDNPPEICRQPGGEFAGGKVLLRHACPALVEAAEQKLRGEVPEPAAFHAAARPAQPAARRRDRHRRSRLHPFPARRRRIARSIWARGSIHPRSGRHCPARGALDADNEFRREKPDFAVVTGAIDAAAGLDLAFREYGLEAVAEFRSSGRNFLLKIVRKLRPLKPAALGLSRTGLTAAHQRAALTGQVR